MRTGGILPIILLLSIVATVFSKSKNVVCPKKKSNHKVTIKNGQSFNYRTQKGAKYGKNVKCKVQYKRDTTCENLNFACSSFDVINNEECGQRKGDRMVVNGDKYCQREGPDFTTNGTNLNVNFISGRKKHGTGAKCIIQCLTNDQLSTTTEATTTEATTTETTTEATTTEGGPLPEDDSLPLKRLLMSSLYQNSPANGVDKCIDGDLDTNCITAGRSVESHPWVAIELNCVTSVRSVVITNRRGCAVCAPRLRDVKVFVSNALPTDASSYMNADGASLFGTYTGPASDGEIVTINGSASGNYIIVQYPTDYINLAEIAVKGVLCTPTETPPTSSSSNPECAERQNRTHKNILFLGNSYTSANNLKVIVQNLANRVGFSATVQASNPGGQTLNWHAQNSLGLIRNGDWDAVVLQDQSQRPSFGSGYVNSYIIPDTRVLVQAIRETNPCTTPVFYQTWGKRDGDSGNCRDGNYFCTFDGIQDQLTDAYNSMAAANPPSVVAPAGEAWRAWSNTRELFQADGSHPHLLGSYLTACTIFQAVYQIPCTASLHRPYAKSAALQETAAQVWESQNWSYPQ